MASLELKLTLDFGEEVSINLPECLADEEVVSLLKTLEKKLANHLSPEASDKIKLLTGPNSCLLPSVGKNSATSSNRGGQAASGTASVKKRTEAAVQVRHLIGLSLKCVSSLKTEHFCIFKVSPQSFISESVCCTYFD